jgi:hypothetical protein
MANKRQWQEANAEEQKKIQTIIEKHVDGVRAFLASQNLTFAVLLDGTTIK